LFYSGVIREHKCQKDIIQSFLKLENKYRNLRLIFSGKILQPNYYKELQGIIPAKTKPKITFTGNVPLKKLIELYNTCDIFVSASSHELFGLSVAEAMSCAKPVVATACGSIPELVLDQKTGLLVKANLWRSGKKPGVENIETLSEKIELLIKNKALRNKLGKNGRKRIINNFTWEKVANNCLNIYKSSLQNGKK